MQKFWGIKYDQWSRQNPESRLTVLATTSSNLPDRPIRTERISTSSDAKERNISAVDRAERILCVCSRNILL
jgi:hypothetical protein